MINGYGVFLILILVVSLVGDAADAKFKPNPDLSLILSLAKSALMVWLIFQI